MWRWVNWEGRITLRPYRTLDAEATVRGEPLVSDWGRDDIGQSAVGKAVLPYGPAEASIPRRLFRGEPLVSDCGRHLVDRGLGRPYHHTTLQETG
jgi:hypothetical protein